MADPRLEPVLDQMARSNVRRVVVQPHLLFAGVLVDRVDALVARYRRAHSEVEWLVARHLGPTAAVASALVERARSAAASVFQRS
jgi:sirohydrochlorin ferrochelatase